MTYEPTKISGIPISEYEARGGNAMTAALIFKVLGMICVPIGVIVSFMIFHPSGNAIAWTITGWIAFYVIASIPIVYWAKSRVLWCIWAVFLLLTVVCIAMTFIAPLP